MDVYLARRNGNWSKYSNCIGVELTGAQQFGSAVTGVAATDIITVTGGNPVNGNPVFFASLTGGTNLTAGVVYYWRDASTNTGKLAATPGGAAIDFSTNITAATLMSANPEMTIWSPSYRNQFQTTLRAIASASSMFPSGEISAPAMLTELENQQITIVGGTSVSSSPTFDEKSDEVIGAPLRQDPLNVTHWRFQINTAGLPAESIAPPIYLYATWADGDMIANNPPEITT